MNNQAYGGITLSYELAASDAVGLWFASFRPRTFGDFNVSAQVKLPNFTPCLAYDSEIELASDLHLFIDQVDSGSSLLSLDDSGQRLSWNWQIKPCEADLYSKTFLSYYSAPNGRHYRALLNIAGDQGEWQDSLGRRGSWHGEYQ